MSVRNLNKNQKNFSLILIFMIFISYFVGFIYQENSAGGAVDDFQNTKKNIVLFKNNSFLDSIKATATTDDKIFQSTRAPGFYVFNKYVNPYTTEIRKYQSVITVFSLLIPILLFLNLRLKYKHVDKNLLFFLSSITLLSPYLRSSAFWGNEENFGIVMVGFSGLFLQLYFKTKIIFKRFFYLLLLSIFSALCVYSDQKLIIIPLITFFFVIFSNKNFKEKFILFLFYVVLSIPFVLLIKLWGNIVPTGDGIKRNIGFNLNFHHFAFSVSIISFYLFPLILLLTNKKKAVSDVFNYKINYFFSIIFFAVLTYFIFFFNYETMYKMGGGVFQRLTVEITQDIFFQKLILTLIFLFSWLILLLFINKKISNILILLFFPFFSIFISPALFQEYFDPLIYFLILVYLKQNFKIDFKRVSIISVYFLIFLIVGLNYYN